jgi:predicted nucleic acid-binding protein
MPQLLWDASALSKRYSLETGSDAVDILFAGRRSVAMRTTFLCYAETCASLLRKRNRGEFNTTIFAKARDTLRYEVLLDPDFALMTVDDSDILTGITLTDRHNLNSTDAAILAAYLRFARAQPVSAPTCILVTADHRFLRASVAEGRRAVNPEALPATDVPAFLASV